MYNSVKYLFRNVVRIGDYYRRFMIKYVKRYFYRCCLGYCGKKVDYTIPAQLRLETLSIL